MRIHYKRRQPFKPASALYRVNEHIRVPEVRVIDETGTFLGVLKTDEALRTAKERGYDLVEVSPKEQPPVCKFLDYGQFKYQKEKELRAQKAHARKVEVKGIRLSVKMGDHDENIRREKAVEFFEDGHKIKIEVMLRGREKAHGDLAKKRIEQFISKLQETYPLYIEQPVTRQAGNFSAIVGRK
ncbi:MAG TPA: translation initiation factor IF-3 [Candidatus Methylomirabilis sp.]|nr:translation initiation factor IF-3 [Candidatus Methylomirabilis sp.]